MNSVQLIGRLTKDVELKYYKKNDGTDYAMSRLSIAVNDESGDKQKSYFINCFSVGKISEVIAKYFHKGNQIGIEGKIVTGSYEKEGKTFYTTEVRIDNITFLDKKDDRPQETSQEQPKSVDVWESAKSMNFEDDDNLPFY